MNHKRLRRIAASLMGFLLLFVLLFSSFYIAAESQHECDGEDCHICSVLEQCENTLQQIGTAGNVRTAVSVAVLLLVFAACLVVFSVPRKTLVTDKVRMNN